ncbi:oligosaccharide flippase family protein [Thioclava sp. L04-15]|uniref:lipopolysaccharide biosynthesis protein n=1 Tax=Thioclava sp. L04-15 TaxID=1915318 RepID=UPI00248BF51C|nr:oligosaccharide flippase family protein [Thioclava sp. L04-15]
MGSSSVGLGLTLVTTPIMTRLFPADAYGINGMMMTLATLVAGFGMLGLPLALAREQHGNEQIRLLHAAVQIAVVLFGLCGIAALAVQFFPYKLPAGVTAQVLLILPILVFLHCAQRVADSLINAKGRFPAQAAARIGNAFTGRGGALLLGWLVQPLAASMLAGDCIGRFVHVVLTIELGRLRPDCKSINWRPHPKFLLKTVSEYRRFALQSNFAAALPMVSVLVVQLMLAIRLGAEAVGYYTLAQSIITLPVTVVALSSAPVVFHRFVRAADEAPDSLPKLAQKAILGYLLLGGLCMMPLILFGQTLFEFAFGKDWIAAGSTAAILAVPQVLNFGLTGVLSIFRVNRRINAWMIFEGAGTFVILLGMLLLPRDFDLRSATIMLAGLRGLYCTLMISGCLWAAKQKGEWS